MLHQQRLAEQLQHRLAAARAAPLHGELARKRLDRIEHVGDLALAAAEHHALGERIGDDEQPFHGKLLDDDRAAHLYRLVRLARDLDLGGLLLGRIDQPERPRPQALEKLGLFRRRHADEDDDAIAKHHRNAARSDADGERCRVQHLALEARGVDAVGDLQRAGGELRDGRGLCHRTSLAGPGKEFDDKHLRKSSDLLSGGFDSNPHALNPLDSIGRNSSLRTQWRRIIHPCRTRAPPTSTPPFRSSAALPG
ncbi:hypothetical protein BRAS3843_120109 [Bradyrhizobium sp. STM 3843]|nr:hypothetical protein BRAS3843_120109 [Bradyrhizobium sp. STM 3843]